MAEIALPPLPHTFLQAVARMEGFYVDGSRAQRNCNPGNIRAGKFAFEHGCKGGDGQFAVFPTPAAGFAAMRALFQTSGYKGKTVAQALNRWAPPTDGNDTSSYIANVCKWTGCSPDDVIDALVEA